MKYSLVLIISLLGYAFKEPPSLYPDEVEDEVAQAEQRLLWISCLMLCSSGIDGEKSEIILISQQFGQPYNLLVQKIGADFLESCLGAMDLEMASVVVRLNSSELTQFNKREFFLLERERYQNSSLVLSEDQKGIVGGILKEINSVEDGFDQTPPIVSEVLQLKETSLGVYVAGVGMTGACLWVVWKMFDGSGVQKRDKVE